MPVKTPFKPVIVVEQISIRPFIARIQMKLIPDASPLPESHFLPGPTRGLPAKKEEQNLLP